MLKTISLQLDEGLLRRVDAARGDTPRQRFVARLLEEALPRGVVRDEIVMESQPSPPNVRHEPPPPSRPTTTLAAMQAGRPIVQKRVKRG